MANDNEITILQATPNDVPLILHFIGKLAEFEKLSHQMSATESLLHEHLFSPKPVAEVLIGKIGGNPAGFALYFATFSTFLGKPGIWLEDLFILPEFRRRGVGKALLRHVAALAVERKCGRLEWCVLDWNTPAVEFYKSIGAEAMVDWTIQRMTGDSLLQFAKKP